MALNGIDISNWQAGIDLSAVPCDFAICKATQGTAYTSPDCCRQVELARSVGKLFGVYHYVAGGNAQAEADFFVVVAVDFTGVLAAEAKATPPLSTYNLNRFPFATRLEPSPFHLRISFAVTP